MYGMLDESCTDRSSATRATPLRDNNQIEMEAKMQHEKETNTKKSVKSWTSDMIQNREEAVNVRTNDLTFFSSILFVASRFVIQTVGYSLTALQIWYYTKIKFYKF